ncbi:hypothetical protein PSTG_04390 [Puccinia striiformis f. sp. tritici PST-78]|uniref:Uncharacterized protein n=2 Tax=Puccinia striiformis f. sp. tritici TaxID=168172 RepID=A0A0L0VU30_9BASI|nr:hypothetical protein PSTG_04390 [Puccinia striiformis f. sp. tritici PST-78]
MVELWRNCNVAVSATSAGVAKTTRAKPVKPVVHSVRKLELSDKRIWKTTFAGPFPVSSFVLYVVPECILTCKNCATNASKNPHKIIIPASSDQIHRAFQITSNPLIPSQPLPPHSPEPAAAQHNQPHPPQAVVHNNTQPQSISVGAAGLVDEEDEEDKEDVVDDQGILQDLDEDLDIILEGNTLPSPALSSCSLPIHPLDTAPVPIIKTDYRTPKNFPVAVTPPPQPPAELKPPNLETKNPVIPLGYDVKDGSRLDLRDEAEENAQRGRLGNKSAFAMGNIEQAWEGLPPELKDVMMGVNGKNRTKIIITNQIEGPINKSEEKMIIINHHLNIDQDQNLEIRRPSSKEEGKKRDSEQQQRHSSQEKAKKDEGGGGHRSSSTKITNGGSSRRRKSRCAADGDDNKDEDHHSPLEPADEQDHNDKIKEREGERDCDKDKERDKDKDEVDHAEGD